MTLNSKQREFLQARLNVKVPRKKSIFSSRTSAEEEDKALTESYERILTDAEVLRVRLDHLRHLWGAAPEVHLAKLKSIEDELHSSDPKSAAVAFTKAKLALAALTGDVEAAVKAAEADPDMKGREPYTRDLEVRQRDLALLGTLPCVEPDELTACEKALKDARDLARPGTPDAFKAARKQLEACSKQFKAVREAAAKRQKAVAEQRGHKPECEARLAEATAALGRLSALPGVQADLLKLNAILNAAKGLADKGYWSDAEKELKRLDVAKQEKALRATSAKALAGVQDPRFGEQQQLGLSMLETLRRWESPETVAARSARFHDAVKQTVDKAGSRPLPAVLEELKEACRTAQISANATTDLVARARSELDAARPVLSVVEVRLFEKRLQDLGRLAERRDHLSVAAAGSAILADIGRDLPARRAAHDEWLRNQSIAAELRKRIDFLRENSTCAAVKTECLSVMNRVAEFEIRRLEDGAEWSTLVANLELARQGVVRLVELEKTYRGFATARADADRDFQASLAGAKTDIVAFRQLVDRARGKGGEDAGKDFEVRRAALERDWAATRSRAATPRDLRAADFLRALETLRQDVAAAASPDRVRAWLEAEAQRKAAAEFELAWTRFQAELTALQNVDLAGAEELAGLAGKVRAGGATDWNAAKASLATLSTSIATRIAAAERSRGEVAGRVDAAANAVTAKIRALRKANSKFESLTDALQAECDRWRLLGQSPNGDAVQEALRQIGDLDKKIAEFDPASGGASLGQVTTRLEAAEKVLKGLKDLLEKNCPKTYVLCTGRLEELKKTVPGQVPDKSLAAIAAFEQFCADARGDAETVAGVRRQFEGLLPFVKKSSEQFTKLGAAPAYAKELAGRVESAEKLAKDPDQLYAALTRIKGVEEALGEAALKPREAIRQEEIIRKRTADEAAAKAEWEGALAVFEKRRLPLAEAAVKAGGAKGLLSELGKIVDAAKAEAKQGDWAKATAKIELAGARALEIVERPQGSGIGARNDLPGDAAKYDQAVAKLGEAVAAFVQSCASLDPKPIGPVANRIRERADEVAAKFPVGAFAAHVRQLTAENLDGKTRRALRESALADVRVLREVAKTHPLVRSLRDNPIDNGVAVALKQLDAALVGLDANISRSCA